MVSVWTKLLKKWSGMVGDKFPKRRDSETIIQGVFRGGVWECMSTSIEKDLLGHHPSKIYIAFKAEHSD